MTLSFAVTWDYRCPFARNVHEHLVNGQAGGADWDLRYVPVLAGTGPRGRRRDRRLGRAREGHRHRRAASRRRRARPVPRAVPEGPPRAVRRSPRRGTEAARARRRAQRAQHQRRRRRRGLRCDRRRHRAQAGADRARGGGRRATTCGACRRSSPATRPCSSASWIAHRRAPIRVCPATRSSASSTCSTRGRT